MTFTKENSGSVVNVAQSSKIAIQVEANPTTGYSWTNVTMSPGLELISTDYKENPRPVSKGVEVGIGGIQTWIIQANAIGDQTFSAIYRRPWEPVTGNEQKYILTIRITKV